MDCRPATFVLLLLAALGFIFGPDLVSGLDLWGPPTVPVTDGQILGGLRLDPSAMRSEQVHGKCGTATIYWNTTVRVTISRSASTGISITRHRMADPNPEG